MVSTPAPASRLVLGKVLPERTGYYLGRRLVEHHLAERHLSATVRAATREIHRSTEQALGIQTA